MTQCQAFIAVVLCCFSVTNSQLTLNITMGFLDTTRQEGIFMRFPAAGLPELTIAKLEFQTSCDLDDAETYWVKYKMSQDFRYIPSLQEWQYREHRDARQQPTTREEYVLYKVVLVQKDGGTLATDRQQSYLESNIQPFSRILALNLQQNANQVTTPNDVATQTLSYGVTDVINTNASGMTDDDDINVVLGITIAIIVALTVVLVTTVLLLVKLRRQLESISKDSAHMIRSSREDDYIRPLPSIPEIAGYQTLMHKDEKKVAEPLSSPTGEDYIQPLPSIPRVYENLRSSDADKSEQDRKTYESLNHSQDRTYAPSTSPLYAASGPSVYTD